MRCNSIIHGAYHSFGGVVCAGAVILMASSVQAQNLFVSTYGSENISEFTPGGAQSTFASGLYSPAGLAFNSAGDLFVADVSSGNIDEFTPGGAQSTFASGLSQPDGLAFNSAGDLFEADGSAAAFMNSRRVERKAPLPPGWVFLLDWPLTARAICLRRIWAAAISMNSRRVERKAPLPPGCIFLKD